MTKTPPLIAPILNSHRANILRLNQEFVHWLSPLDANALDFVLDRSLYRKQINGAEGVLWGYDHTVDYPDHWNIDWLSQKFSRYFYIDRVIIDPTAHRQGYARALYEDVTHFAKANGYPRLVCDVFTQPDNPVSHAFHTDMGFISCGEAMHPHDPARATRYYEKQLFPSS